MWRLLLLTIPDKMSITSICNYYLYCIFSYRYGYTYYNAFKVYTSLCYNHAWCVSTSDIPTGSVVFLLRECRRYRCVLFSQCWNRVFFFLNGKWNSPYAFGKREWFFSSEWAHISIHQTAGWWICAIPFKKIASEHIHFVISTKKKSIVLR